MGEPAQAGRLQTQLAPANDEAASSATHSLGERTISPGLAPFGQDGRRAPRQLRGPRHWPHDHLYGPVVRCKRDRLCDQASQTLLVGGALRIMQVSVPCAISLPVPSVTRPSAVAMRPPEWMILPSQVSFPDVGNTARTNDTVMSRVVNPCLGLSMECTAQPIASSSNVESSRHELYRGGSRICLQARLQTQRARAPP
jgi:hypothetical protein